MKIILAFDSFKGSMTSMQACEAAERAVKEVLPGSETVKIPIADGGEGTVEAYYAVFGGEIVVTGVTSPAGTPAEAKYLILPDKTAVIEMAQASGFTLTPPGTDGGMTDTRGTGMLIKNALGKGCRKFIIGLGGSATNDAGCGALSELGIKFTDKYGKEFKPTGASLKHLHTVDVSGLSAEAKNSKFTIACDVKNKLCGRDGATYIYGTQKNIKNEELDEIDHNLYNFALKTREITGRDILELEGGGAAGGMCAGLYAYLNADIKSGIELLLKLNNFKLQARSCDLILGGEGSADVQSAYGKAVSGIGEYAKKFKKPFIVIAGDVKDGYENIYANGVTAVFSTNHYALPFEKIKNRSRRDLYDTVKNILLLTAKLNGIDSGASPGPDLPA